MAHSLVNINTTRNGLHGLSNELKRERDWGLVKLLLLPVGSAVSISGRMIPDFLVSKSMLDRYFQIAPPIASVEPEFQEIIDEIETAYVTGKFFSTISAACVSTELLLNLARIKLHRHKPRIKELWGKGPSNAWDENINALEGWNYLENEFAHELRSIYKDIRCRYLHSGAISDMQRDALRSVTAGYRLITVFLGFPQDLFRFSSGIECLNHDDPRYIEFYQPHLHSGDQE